VYILKELNKMEIVQIKELLWMVLLLIVNIININIILHYKQILVVVVGFFKIRVDKIRKYIL
jgi:hypothetical protein